MSDLSKAWRKQAKGAVTALLLAAANGASVAGQPEITVIDPPEKDFFSKRLDFHGIPVKAHKVVVDEALYAAYDRLALLFTNLLSSMWYFGTHGDTRMAGPKPENGAEGLKNYDPEAYAVMDDFYSGRIVIGKVESRRARSNAATGAAFSPKANPSQH